MGDWHFANLNSVIKISPHTVRYLSENLKDDKEPVMWLCWEKEFQAKGMANAKALRLAHAWCAYRLAGKPCGSKK